MHVPSAELRKELLSTPGFSRFVRSLGSGGFETTLILKASTLSLKYLIRRAQFSILVRQLPSGKLLYAVLIDEFDSEPAAIWCLVESEEEVTALAALPRIRSFPLFLFNEACTNVCWADVPFALNNTLDSIIRRPLIFSSRVRTEEDSAEAVAAIEIALSELEVRFTLRTTQPLVWHEIKNHYITNQLIASPISILTENEGDQQEELCTWLLDNLSPSGAYKGAQVQEATQQRELTDILLNYPGGCFLVESKTLAVFDRDELPPRSKLRKNVLKNIKKALSQLLGACRNIHAGLQVTSAAGTVIPIELGMPPHCIILVPELSLLTSEDDLGGDRVKQFMEQQKAYLHILDPSELMDLMRAALYMASLGKSTTAMMAFDVMLIKRWEQASELDTPHFTLITHFV